ncbi:RES domain-containing protein [Catalinimonas alkaloidigena]|uniref:RES family NAD+ phosphorylase n=1 Tax=Catalinimonas alkaloidigena TaxID=1075417 RepID=UPI002404B6B6|nr:RES family NAD+ phosphorylase [Catalinimonas alkaloidigena]MDF9797379.1 RES domain-containing protein [Catalinimonas alkaloidigena]
MGKHYTRQGNLWCLFLMLVFRLVRQAYARQLDGKGAALFGGRWNSVGRPLLYTAEHRSLAVLEYRVNNPLPLKDLIMVTLEAPEHAIKTVNTQDLNSHWRAYAPENECAAIGDQWLESQESLMLRVPSAIVPQENNVLINPLHNSMREVKILDATPFLIDHRLYGR